MIDSSDAQSPPMFATVTTCLPAGISTDRSTLTVASYTSGLPGSRGRGLVCFTSGAPGNALNGKSATGSSSTITRSIAASQTLLTRSTIVDGFGRSTRNRAGLNSSGLVALTQ